MMIHFKTIDHTRGGCGFLEVCRMSQYSPPVLVIPEREGGDEVRR
jgi:hypothetical protein